MGQMSGALALGLSTGPGFGAVKNGNKGIKAWSPITCHPSLLGPHPMAALHPQTVSHKPMPMSPIVQTDFWDPRAKTPEPPERAWAWSGHPCGLGFAKCHRTEAQGHSTRENIPAQILLYSPNQICTRQDLNGRPCPR